MIDRARVQGASHRVFLPWPAPQASPAPPPTTSPTVKEQTNSASDLSAEFAEFGIDLEPGGGKRDNHPFESTTTQE